MSERGTFNRIINDTKPVFIDFYATWCGPCKAMEPVVKQLKSEMRDQLRVIKIDIDKNPAIARQLNIRGVPTFALYQSGRQLWKHAGMVTLEHLIQAIEPHLSNQSARA